MTLNYGHSKTVTFMAPVTAGRAIFGPIGATTQGNYPDPPNHARIYMPMEMVRPDSVIQYIAHSFDNIALPTTDNTIVYYLSTFYKTSGAVTNHKTFEFTPPAKVAGTFSQYNIMTYVRIGDAIPEAYFKSASVLNFAVGKKTAGSAIGGWSNILTWVILSPLEITV